MSGMGCLLAASTSTWINARYKQIAPERMSMTSMSTAITKVAATAGVGAKTPSNQDQHDSTVAVHIGTAHADRHGGLQPPCTNTLIRKMVF